MQYKSLWLSLLYIEGARLVISKVVWSNRSPHVQTFCLEKICFRLWQLLGVQCVLKKIGETGHVEDKKSSDRSRSLTNWKAGGSIPSASVCLLNIFEQDPTLLCDASMGV